MAEHDDEMLEAAAAAETQGDPALDAALREKDEAVRNWQRAQADYQNLRRRLSSDIDAAVARSKSALFEDLLLVLDYLEMALATPAKSADATTLRAGVEMTHQQLVKALEREGVRPVRDSGAFDAAIHQAVETVETDAVPSGHIASVSRRGYAQNGTTIRPAQVRVAAGAREGR